MNGYNILIVEDEVSVSKGLKKVLEDEGANVSVNETGEGVVEQLADVHLILMDIMLPFDDGLFPFQRNSSQGRYSNHLFDGNERYRQ